MSEHVRGKPKDVPSRLATSAPEVARAKTLVLVTGAAGAIGSATVRAFLDGGFSVVGFDRAESVVSVSTQDGRYRGFALDLTDPRALADGLGAAGSLGELTHVIGIAGGALDLEARTQHDPAEIDPDTFRSSIEANLTTQFLLVRAALPWLRRNNGADRSVTFTSSFNAMGGWGMPAYSAAKAGIIGMMQAIAAPLGSEGIRTNVVAPGTIRTPRTERIWGHDPQHFDRLRATTATGRLGTPEDVARTFVALATILTHVVGQVIIVDGGQTVKRG